MFELIKIIFFGPLILLGFYYIMWLLRFHDQGRSIGGIAVCMTFGCVLMYAEQALTNFKEKHLTIGIFDLIMVGLFGSLWFNALRAINHSMITKEPMNIASIEFTGIFNLTGFWGIGIIIPIFYSMLILMVCCFFIYEEHFKYRYTYNKDDYYVGKLFIDKITNGGY